MSYRNVTDTLNLMNETGKFGCKKYSLLIFKMLSFIVTDERAKDFHLDGYKLRAANDRLENIKEGYESEKQFDNRKREDK